MSQLEFGQAYGIGNQGMVWQYLNADNPKGSALNVSAAIKFATGLACKVSDFSPAIQEEINKIAAFASYEETTNSDLLASDTRAAIEFLRLPRARRSSLSMDMQAALAFVEKIASEEVERQKKSETKAA